MNFIAALTISDCRGLFTSLPRLRLILVPECMDMTAIPSHFLYESPQVPIEQKLHCCFFALVVIIAVVVIVVVVAVIIAVATIETMWWVQDAHRSI